MRMPAKAIVAVINKKTWWGETSRKVAITLMEGTARSRYGLFKNFLKGKSVLDVGVGVGSMSKILRDRGFKVTGIDIDKSSLYGDMAPIVYDGRNIPLKDKSIDTGLLICVLHHCSEPLKVLEETMRVCKRIVIIEDTFRNGLERFLVAARDSIGNFEFYHHDYRSTKEWLAIFKKRGWKVVYKNEWSSVTFYGMYGRQTLFVIDKVG